MRKFTKQVDPYQQGIRLGKQQRFEEALECFNLAIDQDPNNMKVWYNRGLCLENLGRLTEAFECYLSASEIVPDDPDINRKLEAVKKRIDNAENKSFLEKITATHIAVVFALLVVIIAGSTKIWHMHEEAVAKVRATEPPPPEKEFYNSSVFFDPDKKPKTEQPEDNRFKGIDAADPKSSKGTKDTKPKDTKVEFNGSSNTSTSPVSDDDPFKDNSSLGQQKKDE